MTEKEAQEIYFINIEIERLKKELAELTEGRTYYKPTVMSDMPRGGGEHRNITDDYLEKKERLEDMLRYALRRQQDKLLEFEQFLLTIDDAEMRLILRLRCINNLTWTEIGEEVHMHRTTVHRKFNNYFKTCTQCTLNM